MEENLKNLPIGVFDSGVGGISVLADLIKQLPNEKYIYYGDSHNAPYGIRSPEEVVQLSMDVVNKLMDLGIKALVVACNTATSVAIEEFREKLSIPVIGMEPALKPAIEMGQSGDIIVMATPVTLNEKKFNDLILKFKKDTNVIKMPCPDLVEIIERKGKYTEEVGEYIEKSFSIYNENKIGAIVLGCTHYVFIKDIIRDKLGDEIPLINGNLGTAKHVKHLLEDRNWLLESDIINPKERRVKIINSSKKEEMIVLSKRLLEERLNDLNYKGTIKYI